MRLRIPSPVLLLLPTYFFLFAIVIYPSIYSFVLTFHKYKLTEPLKGWLFIGLDNYREFLNVDPSFWNAVRNNIVFTFGAVSFEFLLGFGLALLLRRDLRFRGAFQSILLAPMMITPVIGGLIWRFILHTTQGPLNAVLDLFFGIKFEFLSTPVTAMLTIILVDTWQWTSFIMLLLVAGLEALPREPYEAAQLDGASRIQIFRHITFPLLLPVIMITILLRLIDAFKLYDLLYILTTGGPGTSTETLSYYIYRVGFAFFNMGYAASMAYFFEYIVLLLSLILIKYGLGRSYR